MVGVPYTAPAKYEPRRWLSVYDRGLDYIRMLPALTVMYYGALDNESKEMYKPFFKSCLPFQGKILAICDALLNILAKAELVYGCKC